MKVFVHFLETCYAIPCGEGDKNVSWLVEETFKRCQESPTTLQTQRQDDFVAKLAKSDAVLCREDKIGDVLEDGDLIYLGGSNGMKLTSYKCKLNFSHSRKALIVDGNSLETLDLVKCGKGEYMIEVSEKSREGVQKARNLINKITDENKVVYGVTTGFGRFANVVIAEENLKKLQENLIRSHSAGVGEHLTTERARTLLALRINVLAKGYSGISVENLDKMIAIFNAGCVSMVPQKGTVGASGDLAPLSHLALGMLGEGLMWGPKTGWADAALVLKVHGLSKLELGPKEGLALINGTQLIAAIGSEALERAKAICRQADIVAAMSFEVLKGTTKAYNEEIHKTRPHKGQLLVASRLRSLLHSEVYESKIAESHRFCTRVQDAYTLRCCPQVHGIVNDTIEFVHDILKVECNSATDNPMVFADLGETMSGGNFHGEYPAKALDYLAIGIHELANMSERRMERLINPAYSGLPAFLVNDGGVNSGFMIAQCTAAALVSENKVLTHPASVDSLSTSAGTEDHVSMGGFAARKALEVVEHVEYVLAIELLGACQGIEFLRPLSTTEPLEAVHKTVRKVVKPYDKDRYMAPDIEAVVKLLQEEKIWEVVAPFMERYEKELKCLPSRVDSDYIRPHSPTSHVDSGPE